MFWPTTTFILWHGTENASAQDIVSGGVKIQTHRNGRRTKTWDFGPGFYTTTRRDKAVQWSEQTASLTGRCNIPMLVCFEIPLQRFVDFNKLTFADGGVGNDLFWTFVRACREGVLPANSNPGVNFDVVVGPVSASVGIDLGDCRAVPDIDQVCFMEGVGVRFLNQWPRTVQSP